MTDASRLVETPSSSPAALDQEALRRRIDAATRSGESAVLLDACTHYLIAYPDTGWVWNRWAIAAVALGDAAGAETGFLHAIASPERSEAHFAHASLSGLYLAQQRPEAIHHAREAVRLKPGFATGWHNLGNALLKMGDPREALVAFAQATFNGSPDSVAQLYETKRRLCDWDKLEDLEALALRRAMERPEKTPALVFFGFLPTTAAQQRAWAERWSVLRHGPAAPRPHPRFRQTGVSGGPGEKVRLGYLSADFANHPVSQLLVGVLEHHDRSRFEVVGLSLTPPARTHPDDRIRRAFDEFHDLYPASDEAAAALITDQKIDILLDLNGYTAGARTGILARRPAPVQINYLGWPGTMGATFMDYIIADRAVAPEPSAFTEAVLYLDGYLPTDSRRPSPPPPSREDLGLPADALVIASMNAAWKLNPALFDIWTEALRASPEAVLWQNTTGGDKAAWENLRAEAARRGVGHQLLFAPALEDQAAHLARLGQADLAFDAAPYGGHATTVDLLWAGVPVLTLAGESFCARVAASILTRAGLGELVAGSLEDYRRKALELIGDRVRLRRLKHRLLASRSRLPLFDTARYTRALETALLGTLPPRDFTG